MHGVTTKKIKDITLQEIITLSVLSYVKQL